MVPTKYVTAALASAALALAAPALAGAALPSTGSGVISDGEHRIALFVEGGTGVAVYDTRTKQQIGATVALPTDVVFPTAQSLRFWNTVGFVDDRVLLRASGSSVENQALVFADPLSGGSEVVCAEAGYAGRAPCPSSIIEGVGRRWLFVRIPNARVSQIKGILRYSVDDGQLTSSIQSPAELKRYRRAVPGAGTISANSVDLDARRATLDDRWGFRRNVQPGGGSTPGLSNSFNVTLTRTGDGKPAILRFRGPSVTDIVRVDFGARGMCASTRRQVVLWDRTTRQIWRRAIPRGARSQSTVCTRDNVILELSGVAEGSSPLGPVWRWPTKRSPGGWVAGPKLLPGTTRTYR